MERNAPSHESSVSTRATGTFRALMLMLICAGCLVAPPVSHGVELKEETVKTWDAYIQAANSQMGSQAPFLWVDQEPERLQRVRGGETLVSPVGPQVPKPVPSGLIHDWMGAAFLPGVRIADILSAVRDYGNYKAYYEPTVVDSRLLSSAGPCERYSMRVVNNEVVSQTALDMEYETCYFKIDDRRWYSITHTTRVQEVRHYGRANEQDLPPNQGTGYIWRLYSIAKYEQRDGGTYVEVEAIALSRDIPSAVRWFVNPIVRRVSRNSLLTSLQQTKEAVRLKEDTSRGAELPTSADDRSRGGFASEVTVIDRFAPAGKP